MKVDFKVVRDASKTVDKLANPALIFVLFFIKKKNPTILTQLNAFEMTRLLIFSPQTYFYNHRVIQYTACV